MAKLFPTIEEIFRSKVKPEDGETTLLKFLEENLDDSYEVYFQPQLNGDYPDIIVMRKGSGVMILEVKDWDLNNYELDEKRNWVLKNIRDPVGEKQRVKESPLTQVYRYKVNLFNLHIESLLERQIKNPKMFSIVNCATYFHNANKRQIEDFVTKDYKDNKSYIKWLSYFVFFGNDSLTNDYLNQVLSKQRLNRPSNLFTDDLYTSFKRYLQSSVHKREQGKVIIYRPEQKKFIESKRSIQQKLKGVAGSGKTLILAKRAVNAHLRHKEPVLILTYNISLRNYIHDKISEVRENFNWSNFLITHYHQFISAQANNHNIVCGDIENPDQEMFESVKDSLQKFKTILIDEIQDYQPDWVKLIRKYFLEKDGEFVVFGDEKQNIYSRNMDDDKSPYTGMRGRWNILNESHRIMPDIASIAEKFQSYFFKDKYNIDHIISVQGDLFIDSLIHYYYLNTPDKKQIVNIYQNILEDKQMHDNDVAFLSCKIDFLRSIDKQIRDNFHKRTKTMFETAEIYEKLKKDHQSDYFDLQNRIKDIRRNKKFNFWMNPGITKFSTVASFKGWEIPTLFLLIENDIHTSDEHVYTAITRCRQNLIIINIGNKRYDDFFKKVAKLSNSKINSK